MVHTWIATELNLRTITSRLKKPIICKRYEEPIKVGQTVWHNRRAHYHQKCLDEMRV